MSAGTLFRYVLRHVVGGVLMALGVILALVVLIDFVELSRTIGTRSDVEAFTLLSLALMRAPMLIETALPFIVLFGTMFAMFQLNRKRELVVLRAAGMSAWRFIAPGVTLAIVGGVLATTALSPAAARLSEVFEIRRQQIVSPGKVPGINVSKEGVWLREARADGQVVMSAQNAEDGGRLLQRLTMYIYENDSAGVPAFTRRIDADRAQLQAGFWLLDNAWERAPDVDPVRYEQLSIPTDLDPSGLLERFGSPSTLSFWDLPRQSRLLREAGFASDAYDLRWLRLLAAPITLAAMAVLAAAVSLRLARRGGAFQLAVAGAGLGFALFFLENLLAALGSTGVLPLSLAAWAAPTFALLGGLYVVSHLEDG